MELEIVICVTAALPTPVMACVAKRCVRDIVLHLLRGVITLVHLIRGHYGVVLIGRGTVCTPTIILGAEKSFC